MKIKTTLVLLLAGLLVLTACALPGLTPPPPTNTPGPSPTATTPPTLTPIPTFTPTPTPLPAVRIAAGDKALANGDYQQAHDEYQNALASSTDDAVRTQALFGVAKAEFLFEDYAAALDALRTLAQTYPNATQTAEAQFLLGETYFDLQRYQEAADAYAVYLQLRPGLLDAYVQEQRGDALTAVSNYADALGAYEAALKADGQQDPTSMQIKIANTYAAGGNPSVALTMYDQFSAGTTNDYFKAQMDYLAGRALVQLNRAPEAYTRWQDAVNNYPKSFYAYLAVVALLDADQTVDDLNRGLADYFAGYQLPSSDDARAGRLGAALAAFGRYIADHPDNDGTALYYSALTLREEGEYQQAIDAWTKFINSYTDNTRWATAWDERAYTEWAYLDEYTVAAQGLQDFAAKVVGSPSTVTYLTEAGRIYERAGKLDQAAALWESLPDQYPSDGTFGESTFQAGIVRYRLGDYPKALHDFQRSLSLVSDLSDRTRATLWIGKAYEASGDHTDAQSAWQQTQAMDTVDYYSLRAGDLLEKRAPFAQAPSYNLSYDLGKERTDAAAWLSVKFKLPAGTDLTGIGALASDTRLQRGTEFWKLGMYDQARVEFEALRGAVQNDPADSFRLGNYLLDLGAYRSAIDTIFQVLTIAGMDFPASLNAPIYFSHARYGLYFSDIIWPAATENGLDPLFVTSVVRWESRFEGFANSTAAARGLMQIIPSTGAGIAKQMGWPPNYSDDDLYSPYINVRMGTNYLSANNRLLDGDLYAALAAYDGGPGNAQIWKSLANGDPDLLLEIIRLSEPQNYIRGIYQTYTIYRGLYSVMK